LQVRLNVVLLDLKQTFLVQDEKNNRKRGGMYEKGKHRSKMYSDTSSGDRGVLDATTVVKELRTW